MKINKPLQSCGGLSFRHELKYLIDVSEANLLRVRLAALTERDANAGKTGVYKIRSVYFDDYWDTAYEEKMMGVDTRCKYRIRVYNDSDALINLERKLKRGAYIAKQSANLTRDEAERLVDGDYSFLYGHPQQLCREFYYECSAKIMRPRATVDYEREPYVFQAGDVRITFDMDLRAAILSFDLFDPVLPSINVLEPSQMILEVKYTEFLPSFIRQALPSRAAPWLSLSKYNMVCDRITFLTAKQGY